MEGVDADAQAGGPVVGFSRNPFLPLAPSIGSDFSRQLGSPSLSLYQRLCGSGDRGREVLGKRMEAGDEGEGKGVEREADMEAGARGVGVCA